MIAGHGMSETAGDPVVKRARPCYPGCMRKFICVLLSLALLSVTGLVGAHTAPHESTAGATATQMSHKACAVDILCRDGMSGRTLPCTGDILAVVPGIGPVSCEPEADFPAEATGTAATGHSPETPVGPPKA